MPSFETLSRSAKDDCTPGCAGCNDFSDSRADVLGGVSELGEERVHLLLCGSDTSMNYGGHGSKPASAVRCDPQYTRPQREQG
jgi:hypothetical protein